MIRLRLTLALDVLGVACLTVAAFLVAPALGVFVLGVSCLVFSALLERN